LRGGPDDPRHQQDLGVAAFRHNEHEPLEFVEIFRIMRSFNLVLWKRTSPEDVNRTGRDNDRGPESLGVMLRLIAGLDLSHLDQIASYIHAVTAGSSSVPPESILRSR
jgi:hypothetical protein